LSVRSSPLEARVNRSQAVRFADLERKRTSNSKALLMPGEQLVKSYGQNREIVENGIGKVAQQIQQRLKNHLPAIERFCVLAR
jgi:hypothetical protein